MAKKHPQEWKAIEAERTKTEKAEDRELQRMLLRAQMGGTVPPAPVAVEPAISKTDIGPAETAPAFVCDVCGADFGTKGVLEKHKLTHK